MYKILKRIYTETTETAVCLVSTFSNYHGKNKDMTAPSKFPPALSLLDGRSSYAGELGVTLISTKFIQKEMI